jgi:hypothetical protein
MIYLLARLLQLAGLIILPAAVMANVMNELSLKDSLSLSAVGILVFFLGWLLQKAARPR